MSYYNAETRGLHALRDSAEEIFGHEWNSLFEERCEHPLGLEAFDAIFPPSEVEKWSKKDSEPLSKKDSDTVSAPVSKKARPRRRRSDARDQQTIELIQNSAFSASACVGVTLASKLSPLLTPPKQPISCKVKLASNDNRKPPSWEFTSDRAKMFAAAKAIEGRCYEFTLNLGHKRHAEALASPKGFGKYISQKIMDALKRRFDEVPAVVYSVDKAGDGRLHLHGFIGCTEETREAVSDSLKAAGGAWGKSRGEEHQLNLKPPEDSPEGWINYSRRRSGGVRKLIGAKPLYISQPLRREARAWYEALGQSLRFMLS